LRVPRIREEAGPSARSLTARDGRRRGRPRPWRRAAASPRAGSRPGFVFAPGMGDRCAFVTACPDQQPSTALGVRAAAASCCAQQRSRSLLDATPIFAAAADPATSAGRPRAGPSRSRVIAGRSPIQTGAHGAGPPVLGRQLDGNRVIVHCDTPRKKLLPHSSRKRPLSRRVREICAGNSRWVTVARTDISRVAVGYRKGRDRWPHTLHSTRSKTFSTHRGRPDGSNHDHRGSGR
jgi:hypothetical protein